MLSCRFTRTSHKIESVKIVLIGYMGSGKSTVGRVLSEKMGLLFVDLDEAIEEGEGKTIAALFKERGEITFRKIEHRYLTSILRENDNLVLATGGGAPCYSGNMQTILNATDHVFYLKLSINGLVERLAPQKSNRPLIAHLTKEEMPDFFGKHLFERNTFYNQANYTIVCDGKSVDDIVREIEGKLV